MRFWFQSPVCRQEIPCEAMLFGAADGMIAILRKCKPFVRRQLITGGTPSDYFASESSLGTSQDHHDNYYHGNNRDFDNYGRASYDSSFIPSSNYGTGSYDDSYSNSYDNNFQARSNQQRGSQRIYEIDHYKGSSSSTDSMSSSYSSTKSSIAMGGTRAYRAPLRDVAIGSINSIRNLDKDFNRLRPLTSLHVDESDIVDSNTVLPDVYRLRKHHQDSEVEDSGLETGIEELGLDDDEMVDLDYDQDMEEGGEEVRMPQQRWKTDEHGQRTRPSTQDMHLI
ncbi:hypothetical protein BGZ76_004178 [Entomortierella beljakovae]|nr:hypothetical protein BGZ76_004178 [Entomortierella beljakovae]